MLLSRRCIFAALASLSIGSVAAAQGPVQTHIRGVIDGIDANELTVVTGTDDKVTLKLAADARVTVIAPIAIDAIKLGSFTGTAAVLQPDGTLTALEIQVFPESMRGVGEGHRPWDLGPDSTMTNGTIGRLQVSIGQVSDGQHSKGRVLTLVYKGGEQTVFVPENAPVITYEPGSKAELTRGAHVIVTATTGADER